MKEYAEKEELLSQPRRVLISCFFSENGTIITPLWLFYIDFGLFCKKFCRLVQYTRMKNFNNSFQSAVNARRKGKEIPNSSVVAETMKLLAKSKYGNQTMDQSRNAVKTDLSDEHKHRTIKYKMFKRLGYFNDEVHEMELVKSRIEHKGPIIFGFLYSAVCKSGNVAAV